MSIFRNGRHRRCPHYARIATLTALTIIYLSSVGVIFTFGAW
jgi:hypothetical protein